MQKQAELHRILPVLTFIILLAFLYLTFPERLASGPTGLAFSAQDVVAGCAVINTSTSLTANATGTETCMIINASNLYFNCSGFTIFYDSNGVGGDGIAADSVRNVTVMNCLIHDINASGADGYGINFTSVNDSFIINTTILTNGTSSNNGIRLRVFSMNNTIRNNSIRTLGTSTANDGILLASTVMGTTVGSNIITTNGTSFNRGITLSASHNNTVENNTIQTGGTTDPGTTVATGNNVGILFAPGHQNNVSNNRINTSGPGNYNYGMHIRAGSFRNRALYNVIHGTTRVTCCSYGISLHGSGTSNNTVAFNNITTNATNAPHGIVSQASALDNLIANNSIIVRHREDDDDAGALIIADASGTVVIGNRLESNHQGLRLDGSVTSSNFTDNVITTQGNSSDNSGITITSSTGNIITRNNITTNGTASHGFRLVTGSHDNTITGNNVTVAGNFSYVIFISASNNSVIRNMIFTDTAPWFNTSDSGIFTNFTNLTFSLVSGRIRFPGTVIANGTQDVTLGKLNVTSNRVFLNSTNLTFLNASAQITLFNITFTDPIPRVDFEDDGTFVNCPATICTEESFVSNTFVFNVTQFSSFSAGEGAGVGGAAGTGGGGAKRILNKTTAFEEYNRYQQTLRQEQLEQEPQTEQPALPAIKTSNTESQTTEQQSQLQAPQAPATTPEQSLATAAATRDQEAVLTVQDTRPDAVLASLFYGIALIALVGLGAYWYLHEHKRL